MQTIALGNIFKIFVRKRYIFYLLMLAVLIQQKLLTGHLYDSHVTCPYNDLLRFCIFVAVYLAGV